MPAVREPFRRTYVYADAGERAKIRGKTARQFVVLFFADHFSGRKETDIGIFVQIILRNLFLLTKSLFIVKILGKSEKSVCKICICVVYYLGILEENTKL